MNCQGGKWLSPAVNDRMGDNGTGLPLLLVDLKMEVFACKLCRCSRNAFGYPRLHHFSEEALCSFYKRQLVGKTSFQ